MIWKVFMALAVGIGALGAIQASNAAADGEAKGNFEIVAQSAGPGVYRLNATTGEVLFCWPSSIHHTSYELICTEARPRRN